MLIKRLLARVHLGGSPPAAAEPAFAAGGKPLVSWKSPNGLTVIDGPHGLYSPQMDRRTLNAASEELAIALRAGDLAGAEKIIKAGPGDLALTNAVLGRRNLYQVPWLAPAAGAPARKDIMLVGWGTGSHDAHLVNELKLRGADVELVGSLGSIKFAEDGTLLINGNPRAMPEAVMGAPMSPDSLRPFLDRFEAEGVFVLNRGSAQLAGRDKNVMAEIWSQADVSIPASRPNLMTLDDVRQAGMQLGYPAVLKDPRSAVSRGVWGVASEDEALKIADDFWKGRTGPRSGPASLKQPDRGLLMQEMLDMGAADIRFHGARDAVTGEMRIVGATERVALGSDFRANGGVKGNMIRPIYRLDGSDPALPQSVIDEGLRAGNAAGLDWYSADIGRLRANGKPVIIEVDNYPHALEFNQPVPREQQTFPRAADLLVYGDRDAIAAQRALHDVPNLRDRAVAGAA